MNPTERRLKLLYILYNRGKVQGKDLCVEFGVSRKTIYRDVDLLSKDFLIERIRARGGGYRLISPKLNPSHVLSNDEMEILKILFEEGEKKGIEEIKLKMIMKKLTEQARISSEDDEKNKDKNR